MKTNILFLDFDGPLFSSRALFLTENTFPHNLEHVEALKLNPQATHWKADPVAVAFLNTLLAASPYQIVVSSSWADEGNHSKEGIFNLLKANGIKAPLHKDWKLNKQNMMWDRLYHVKDWLDRNKPDNYVIIDDVHSGGSLAKESSVMDLGMDPSSIVLVDIENGISHQDYQILKKKMLNWNDSPSMTPKKT